MTCAIIASISSTSSSRPVAHVVGHVLDAEAHAGERGAQIVADRADHRGTIVDEGAQPALHQIEGVRGTADLGRPVERADRRRWIAAQLLGRACEAVDRLDQPPREQPAERRHQRQADHEPQQYAPLPAVGERLGRGLHDRPAAIGHLQCSHEIALDERRRRQTEQPARRRADRDRWA
jgi:hypothetical protein